MSKTKVIGVLLLIVAFATIAGVIIDNVAYWLAYNWIVIVVCVISGIILLKEK